MPESPKASSQIKEEVEKAKEALEPLDFKPLFKLQS